MSPSRLRIPLVLLLAAVLVGALSVFAGSGDALAQASAAAPAATKAPAASAQPAAAALPVAKGPPPRVPQPIDFPHERHAGAASDGNMEINCLYCHSSARRSAVAGIPPLSKCMGCHKNVATDKPEIKKLTGYWERGEPVPWKKVHDLPDFVYFSHERHVQRFVFAQGQPVQQACGYCHGDVKTMGVAEKKKPITMGWCLSCHKQFQKNPSDTPLPADEWVIKATDKPITTRTPQEIKAAHTRMAPRDCMECHK